VPTTAPQHRWRAGRLSQPASEPCPQSQAEVPMSVVSETTSREAFVTLD
jgi:hypothetical protein